MLSRITLTVLFLLAFAGWVAAQRTIQGKVTDSAGDPLIGVNIVVKGTTTGTVTDLDGAYSLNVPAGAGRLTFSYTGYATQEVTLDVSNVVDVILQETAIGLDEVVVVGYGTEIRSDLTGNVASLSAKDIQNLPVNSVESAIQGRTSGVFIERGSGKLGEAIKVRVRGTSSISGTNQPLYVVDGIPVTQENQGITNNQPTNPLADLNPADIASIEILKDASAAAIYGSRASNGVVIITTKRGQQGRTSINVNVQYGVSQPTKKLEFLNAAEYRELYTESVLRLFGYDPLTANQEQIDEVQGVLESVAPGFTSRPNEDVDWQDQAFRDDAGYQQLDLSASGGNERTQYFAGLSWNDQRGILINNNFERISGRLNLDQQATDRLRFGLNLSLTRSTLDRVSDDNAFATPLQLVAQAPVTPAYLDNGEPNPNTIYYNGLIEKKYASATNQVYRTLGAVTGAYDLLPGLRFRTEFGVDYLDQQEEVYQGRLTQDGAPGGQASSRALRVLNYTTNNFFSFDRSFGQAHDLSAVLGMSFQQSDRNITSLQARGFPSDDLNTIANAAEPIFTSSVVDGFSFLSYFLRANYKLNDRYLLSLSGRVDGSSKFGANNRYGFFPAASAGWIVSNEPFLAGSRTLSYLKLRASYGITGNAPEANFASLGTWTGNNYTTTSGLSPSTLPSPNLKWETTRQFNVGLDVGLFEDRFTVGLDYYQKLTDDLLLSRPLPAISGYVSIFENVGELKNEGVEAVFSSRNLVGRFKWSTDFNIAFNRNEVTRLNRDNDIISGVNRVRLGEPVGVFVMRRYAGVDPQTGNARYDDGEGGTTGSFNAAPNVVVGDPNPDFIGGLNNTFSWKGFDLNVFFQFVYGNEIYNNAGRFQSMNASNGLDNQTRDQLRRWRQPGDITDVPRADLGAPASQVGAVTSSRYLADGSYLRLKSATLSYNLPGQALRNIGLRSLRFYVTGLNLWTLTDYTGWDPEVTYNASGLTPTQSNLVQGTDFYTAPQERTITFGLTAGF